MEEFAVKGIILDARPQGEYGRRLTMLTDTLGRITVFAQGAAKQGSRLGGAVRPFTAASFLIAKGKNAYNIHGADVIDAFSELPLDPDISMYAFYVLELTDYFSAEGMPEEESKTLLNTAFVSLSALRRKELSPQLIIAVTELRLLKTEGIYTERPGFITDAARKAMTRGLWSYVLGAPLSRLFDNRVYEGIFTDDFIKSVNELFKKQVQHAFRSLQILRDL